MAKKVFELNNIVIDEDGKRDKYNINTEGRTTEQFEFPLSLGKFHNVYIGRKDVDSCAEAYSELNNVNKV